MLTNHGPGDEQINPIVQFIDPALHRAIGAAVVSPSARQ
jgi:hypothetical protein